MGNFLQRLVEIPELLAEQNEVSRVLGNVGTPVPTVDGAEKVTGRAVYAYDVRLPGMLHARVKRSPHPHARIVNLDTTQALSLHGVRAVLTGKDAPRRLRGKGIRDVPILSDAIVRFIGDPVAVVAAETEEIAAQAVDLIQVEYEELPAVMDVEEAAAQNPKVVVHPNLRTYEHEQSGPYAVILDPSRPNVNQHLRVIKGDIEKGFRDAKLVLEHSYRTQAIHHYHTEPSSAVVKVEQDDRITVYTGVQDPQKIRREISEALNMPESRIRILVPKHVGGGFGNRAAAREEVLAVLLAIKTRRPVHIKLTREEVMTVSTARNPSLVKVKDALDEEGSIIAREVTALYNGGAYSTEGITAVRNGIFAAIGVYNIPNLKLEFYRVYTNQIEGGAFRAFGYPQIIFAIESQMDELATSIGMDPGEFRLRHILREGDRNAIGEIVHKFAMERCIRAVKESLSTPAKPTIGWKIGHGIAIGHKALYGGFATLAYVKYRDDDWIDVTLGAVDIGQGIRTAITQIVSDELKHPLDKIRLVELDSDKLPIATGATGSRQMVYGGLAALRACQDLKRKILTLASERIKISIDDLNLEAGEIWSKSQLSKRMQVQQLFSSGPTGGKFVEAEGELLGVGITQLQTGKLEPVTGQLIGERAVVYYTPVAAGADVEVDSDTGRVNVRRVVIAVDVGKAINPKIVEGQIDGCIAMGIGMALYEELVIHEGRILNPDNKDYKVMLSYDAPHAIERIILETNFEEGPRGAKGCGEVALTVVPSAIANAIADAVGARLYSLPATAENILRALKLKNE